MGGWGGHEGHWGVMGGMGAGELLSLDLSLQRFNCHSVTWHQEGKVD